MQIHEDLSSLALFSSASSLCATQEFLTSHRMLFSVARQQRAPQAHAGAAGRTAQSGATGANRTRSQLSSKNCLTGSMEEAKGTEMRAFCGEFVVLKTVYVPVYANPSLVVFGLISMSLKENSGRFSKGLTMASPVSSVMLAFTVCINML